MHFQLNYVRDRKKFFARFARRGSHFSVMSLGLQKLSAALRRGRDKHSEPKKRCLLKNSLGYANSDKYC